MPEESVSPVEQRVAESPRLALDLDPAEQLSDALRWVHFPWTHGPGPGAMAAIAAIAEARRGSLTAATALPLVRARLGGVGFSRGDEEESATVPQFYGERCAPAAEVEVLAWRAAEGVAVVRVRSADHAAAQILELASAHGLHEIVLWVHEPSTGDGGPVYEATRTLLDTIYVSGRVQLGVRGVTLIGW